MQAEDAAGDMIEWNVRIRSSNDDCRVINDTFKNQKDELYKENIPLYQFEVAVPLADLGGASRFLGKAVKFSCIVSTRDSAGEVARWATAISTPHPVDVITDKSSTWAEVKDAVVDFYLRADFNTRGEVIGVTAVPAPYFARPVQKDINNKSRGRGPGHDHVQHVR